jgi:HlyD family secretion protein
MYVKINQFILCAAFMLLGCNDNDHRSDAYGNFEATATLIGTEVGGKLLQLDIEEGNVVDAGELVAQIDTTQLHLQKMKIQATINTLPQKLRNDIEEIQVLQERKANLDRERHRLERLLKSNAATPKQLDDVNGEIDVLEQQVRALKTQTETANAAILSEKGPLIAQMEIVNDQIRRSRVQNPVKGTVLTKLAEQYEVVGPGSPLYRIASLDTMTFRFYIDAVQLQGLALGQDIEVLIDSGSEGYESMPGLVSWISAEAEFTPHTIQTKEDRVSLVYAVKARVPNPDGRLKIGMPGEIKLNP